MTGVVELVNAYRSHGFTPFPLKNMSKEPAARSLAYAERERFRPDNNIGLFTGSPNRLLVVDADEPSARVFVENRLRAIGLLDWTTLVLTPKRKSFHFWLRVADVPSNAQSYYKLPKFIGGGEIRIHRPAYVVAPGSTLVEGQYVFYQGGIEFFLNQPLLHYEDLKWLLPDHAMYGSTGVPDEQNSVRFNFEHVDRPPILALFDYLQRGKGSKIPKVDYKTGERTGDVYHSRSEAEAGLVVGLVMAGWSFEEIELAFKLRKPGHYMEAPLRHNYLAGTYAKATRFVAGRSGSERRG